MVKRNLQPFSGRCVCVKILLRCVVCVHGRAGVYMMTIYHDDNKDCTQNTIDQKREERREERRAEENRRERRREEKSRYRRREMDRKSETPRKIDIN